MLEIRNRSILSAIVIAALLRILWAIAVPVVPVSDSAAYDAFARTLADFGVFGWNKNDPFAFWPPGTTFLHAAIYRLFGPSYPAIVAFNIAVSLAIILTTSRVAGRIFSATIGALSAWVLALWPTLIMYVTVLASELPFMLLITLALDVWTNERRTWFGRAVVAGVLLGAAALVRPLALLLPVVFAAGSLLRGEAIQTSRLRVVAMAGLSLISMAAVIAPWSVRNHSLYNEVVLISTNGGITFWMGNAPGTDGSYMFVPEELSKLPDNEQEKLLSKIAWQHIRDNPGEFVARSIGKLVKLYSNESIGVIWNEPGIAASLGQSAVIPLKRFTQLSWALLFLAAIYGLWSVYRSDGLWRMIKSPAFLVVVYFSAIHSVTVSQDRYHLSFASLIAIYTALGIAGVLTAIRSPSAQGLR